MLPRRRRTCEATGESATVPRRSADGSAIERETPAETPLPMPARFIAILSLLVVMTACRGEQYAERADEVVEVPERYAAATVEGVPMSGWCSEFGSSELAAYVDDAFERNFDLRQGYARLDQARAIRDITRAGLWPTVDAQVEAGRFRQTASGAVGPEAGQVNSFGASLAAGYEIDLWGRLRASARAASYDVEAATADVEAMAISVASETAEAWFDAVLQREKAELLRDQIDIAERFLALTRLRLTQGLATALDVSQQNQQVEQLRGQLALIEAAEETAHHRLAALLGVAPGDVARVTTDELPTLPELPAVGVPAALIEQRPDVRAAMARLEAADERTAAAARAKLPSLRLSGVLFLQAAQLTNLLDDIFWSLTAAVAQTVFRGGELNAERRRAEAEARERLWAYAQTVVDAIVEVESALVLERQHEIYLEHLEEQLEHASRALEFARQRYRNGALDYLRVLTALQSLQEVEQEYVEARRQELSYRVQLCRSLGGDWRVEEAALQ